MTEIAHRWINGQWVASAAARTAFDTTMWPRDRTFRSRILSELAQRVDS
jgi:hypothetical protein